MSERRYELGVIGGGNMAEAIIRAAVERDVLAAGSILVADPVAARRDLFASMGLATTESNDEVTAGSARVLLAIKPQMLESIAPTLAKLGADQLVLSIMAGISCARIEGASGGSAKRVVRVMPNTPLLVGLGASGLAPGSGATDDDVEFALRLFRSAGVAEVVDEAQMDAVTALSGSGPAYLFYLAEAMTEAAAGLGLPADLADRLARQTLLGAATLLSQSDEAAAELRRRVTSPGGTTQAAIEHMENEGVRRRIIAALGKAEARGRELGKV